MEQLPLIAFAVLAVCYCRVIFCTVRETIVSKLANVHIYTDCNFPVRQRRARDSDRDSRLYHKFIDEHPLFFSFVKNVWLIILMPFFATVFSPLVFGSVSPVNADLNIQIMSITVSSYAVFASIGFIIHRVFINRYRADAAMEKLTQDARYLVAVLYDY